MTKESSFVKLRHTPIHSPFGRRYVSCLSVYSSGGLQPRIQLFRGVYRYTAQPPRPAPLAEVYSSTAVYSIQLYSGLQYTAVYIPPLVRSSRGCPGPAKVVASLRSAKRGRLATVSHVSEARSVETKQARVRGTSYLLNL